MKPLFLAFLVITLTLLCLPGLVHAQSGPPVVHAVLFYSPNCEHCYYIITEVLPPLFDQYGDQLQMIGVDVTQPDGQAAFRAAMEIHSIDLEYAGVPFLVVGDTYLMGDVDIPQQFPGFIEYYLAQGGLDWPDIPGLTEMIASVESTQAAQASPTPETTSTPWPTSTPEPLILTGEERASIGDRLAQDPAGNGLAILVLVGMLVAVGWSIRSFRRTPGRPLAGAVLSLIPVLCIVGLGVAGYLAFVETTHSEAICGPVGDCNTVQQSGYARLFGILPIGVLGIVGYLAIIAAWGSIQYTKGKLAEYGALAMLAMTFSGTLFSIYLTFLEPFVIGATCAWCLSSALIMTVLMLLSIAPGKLAATRLQSRDR